MRTTITTTLAFALAGFTASAGSAGEVAPTAVAWDNGAIATSLTGEPGDPAKGRAIVANKSLGNCVACHASNDLADVPFHGEIGPALDGAGARWSEAELRGIVADAKQIFYGTMMPSFYKVEGFTRPGNAYTGKAAEGPLDPLLSAQQIEDVVAYLVTLDEY